MSHLTDMIKAELAHAAEEAVRESIAGGFRSTAAYGRLREVQARAYAQGMPEEDVQAFVAQAQMYAREQQRRG